MLQSDAQLCADHVIGPRVMEDRERAHARG